MSDGGFLLTPEDRRRFVDYCRREAVSLKSMADQIRVLPNMPEALTKNYNARSMAYRIVADDLAKVEDEGL